MKKLLLLSAIFILLFTSANAQVRRHLTVGYLSMDNDGQGATWMSDYTSLGQWSTNYKPPWEAWIPPGGTTDIGYHGVDVDNTGHFDGGGKTIVGQNSWWVGTKNWTAPPEGSWGKDGIEGYLEAGATFDLYLNDNGPNSLLSTINTPFWTDPIQIRRVPQPNVSVDGTELRPVNFPDKQFYEVDPDLISDGYLETKWADPCGAVFHRKVYAYSHPDYANLILNEVVITNTGDCNATIEGIEKPGQTLTDFWIGIKHLIAPPEEWCEYGAQATYNGNMDWLLDYDPETRYFWAWDGDAADIPGDDQFDPRGGPNGLADIPTGEYLVPEVVGMSFIHIDASATDESNDMSQPKTFRYIAYADQVSPLYDNKMVEGWRWMTGEDGNAMYQQGFSGDPYATLSAGEPHYDPIWGIGPYTLGPDEDIKIVYAFALGTVGEARAIELGWRVKNDGLDPAEAKREIYEEGLADLQTQFERAEDLYLNKNLSAPFLPDPPDNVVITSGPEEVVLEWDPVSGASKYKIYRAVGGVDNGRVYAQVAETTETSYLDSPLTRGFSYYYYITAVDASGLESSPFFNRTHRAAVPFRRGLQISEWSDQVRVVPNPHNIKGNTYKSESPHNSTGFNYDGGAREQNTITFVNLPEFCEINIYNSVGDHVTTLEHTSGSADERWWPMITDNNQFPASGVYFYTIEVTEGALAGQVGKGKFIIIR